MTQYFSRDLRLKNLNMNQEVFFVTSGTIPSSTALGEQYIDMTNPDSAGQIQIVSHIPSSVSMAGGGNVQGCGIIFDWDSSAATPNSGLAETDMIRMIGDINSDAGQKLQVNMIAALLTCAADVSTSGNESSIVLGTTRATGPASGGGAVAMGVWGGDFHVEKSSGVADGSMVGLEVGVHKAPTLGSAKNYGVNIWSGDRSGITATVAGTALRIEGGRGWTNLINCIHTDAATEIFKVVADGAMAIKGTSGDLPITFDSNVVSSSTTLEVTGRTGASAAVTVIMQGATGGQGTLGTSTNHDFVIVSNNTEGLRINSSQQFKFAGVGAVGGATISSSTALITPAGTTGVSSLRIPHGAAPTSPVDGDIWTTTAGLFVRINGSTIGPLS